MSWVLTLLGHRRADRAARARALHRRQGRGHARRALLAVLPARPSLGVRRGETEYAIGAIPRGRLREDHRHEPRRDRGARARGGERAYYAQAPWKRIVVILAGPGVNIADRVRPVLGGAALGQPQRRDRAGQPRPVGADARRRRPPCWRSSAASPPTGVLRPGDRIVAVDGRPATVESRDARDRGPPLRRARSRDGCRAATPVQLTVRRAGGMITAVGAAPATARKPGGC